MPGSTAEYWDAASDTYNTKHSADPNYSACLSAVVGQLRARGRVLDVGAGTGMSTRLLRGATEIHAVDFSPKSLALLSRNLPAVRAQVADIRALPFSDGFFDCVLCANTFQHLDASGQVKAIAELMRVLRPGGRYSASARHYSKGQRESGGMKEGKFAGSEADYEYRFTRDEWAALFPGAAIGAAGFSGYPSQVLFARFLGGVMANRGHGDVLTACGVKR